ncbi:uncharacterized protein LOC110727791 [Chenopodium quinoa]|uniref:uncharacterized protein LOC110727791 n=1 Tax=Chenopodium quinoa TaxID=63459 RepID=UPI000B776111|nr:uncharacterized protein LOC110727791 [Chenopodium quinoa]
MGFKKPGNNKKSATTGKTKNKIKLGNKNCRGKVTNESIVKGKKYGSKGQVKKNNTTTGKSKVKDKDNTTKGSAKCKLTEKSTVKDKEKRVKVHKVKLLEDLVSLVDLTKNVRQEKNMGDKSHLFYKSHTFNVTCN